MERTIKESHAFVKSRKPGRVVVQFACSPSPQPSPPRGEGADWPSPSAGKSDVKLNHYQPVAAMAGGPLGRAAGPQAVGGPGARTVPATGAGEGAMDGLDDRAPAALRAFGVSPRCRPPLRGRADRRPARSRGVRGRNVLHTGQCAPIFRLGSRRCSERNAGGAHRS